MRNELQPETLQALDHPQEHHVDYDNTTGCEGGARSCAQGSSTALDMQPGDGPPLDERVKDVVHSVIDALT